MSSPTVAQSTATTTLTTTAETVALTTNTLALNAPNGQGVFIQGTVAGTTGTGVTSVQVRVRIGANTTSGTIVGAVMQESQAASSFFSMAFALLDNTVGVPGTPSGNAVYSVTVQQVGATGNGSVTLASAGIEAANAAGA